MPQRPPNAICLVIDGLHCGYLGAYGNTWLSTPSWNRLASESLVLDFAYVDEPRLESLYRSYWRGVHAAAPGLPSGALEPTLAERLGQAGVWTALLADDPAVSEHPLAAGFDDVLAMNETATADAAADEPPSPAADAGETALVRFFAQLSSRLDEQSDPFLLWAHCGSLGRVWDAPLDMRLALAADEVDEESEPVVLETLHETLPPHRLLAADADPDDLLGYRRAYAAQVNLLDRCLGALMQAMQSSPWGENTLLVVLGARGFPLGEHQRLGWYDLDLHEELTHIPWMMRFPSGLGRLRRSSALVQPADLAMTLAEWFGLESEAPAGDCPGLGRSLFPLIRGQAEAVRDRLLIVGGDGQRALRTPAWLLRSLPAAPGEQPPAAELFVKPDDRWEANEVCDRCPEVASELGAALDELSSPGRMADPSPLAPLGDACLRGIT